MPVMNLLHLRQFESLPNVAAEAQPFVLVSCQEVSFCCCPEITGEIMLVRGKAATQVCWHRDTKRRTISSLSPGLLAFSLGPPSQQKLLHDYESVTAEKKKTSLRERSIVGSHVLLQPVPGSFSLVRICGYQIGLKIATYHLWGAGG